MNESMPTWGKVLGVLFAVAVIGGAMTLIIWLLVEWMSQPSVTGYAVCESSFSGDCFWVDSPKKLHYENGCVTDGTNRICGAYSVTERQQ